jgi:hypothetical protein
MQPPDPSQQELTTWAEIAAYLQVTERTAQTWRKERGLPVKKAGTRVSANVGELERWKASGGLASAPAAQAESAPQWRRRAVVMTIAAAISVAALVLWMRGSPSGGKPVRIEFRADVLAVINDQGKLAWTHRFDAPIEEMGLPFETSRFVDLDGDRNPELLFVHWHEGRVHGLFYFQPNGKLAWRSDIGREISDGQGRSIPHHYWVRDIRILRKPRPDGGRILILAHHASDWPSQVAVLDPQGKQVAEYWHPGWLYAMEVADLDGDSVEEVALGGVNENQKQYGNAATLLVLDSLFQTAQGPVDAGESRIIKGVPPGEPRALLFFPDVLMEDGTPDRASALAGIIWEDDFFDTHVRGKQAFGLVHYQLDRSLKLVTVTPSSVLIEKLLPQGTPHQRRELTERRFGKIRVVKNDFGP